MNSITTLGTAVASTSRTIKIESKKTSAKYFPYFFSTIKGSTEKKEEISKNNRIKNN